MIWDAVKKQLRSVIEWENPDHSVLFELWSERGDEIKDASQLIVKPGQGVVFLYEGKIQGVMTDPGTYDLQTANVPFVTTLEKYMQAFESEHKVGIYFFWQTEFLNQKWGTVSPIKYQDPVYDFPVALRAFGNFSFRLSEPEPFFVNLLGSRERFLVDQLRQTVANRIQQPLTDLMAESGFSYAEIDRNRDELAAALAQKLAPEFERLGLEMTDFRIESTSFDDATNDRIARIADITAEARAAEKAGLDYAQLQQLEALREAARNEGGAAGAGVGIGAGIGLGQTFAQSMAPGAAGGGGQGAAPAADIESRLERLKSLLDKGLISDADYQAKKDAILSEL
ncbi:MAG: SPFH domain-containing protein [Pseudomonadota bacterium]